MMISSKQQRVNSIIQIESEYQMQGPKGEPIPFITISEINTPPYCSFQLHQSSIDLLRSIRHKKIAVATVAGPQRSGKSFLSNRLLKRMNGFAVGPSTLPCTKGLWIWGEPIVLSQDSVLIIMDTEGLNSVRKAFIYLERDINVDAKIFALALLLSSVFIYNSLGHIDQKAVENMGYVLKISENLRVKQEGESQGQISKCFPYFYWVLRDFSLDLRGASENEYLEQCLRPVSQDQNDPKNQIRAKIRMLFNKRFCVCFPRPINEENKLAKIQELQYEQLRQKFKDKMSQFQRTFFETLPLKEVNNKALTAEMYLNLIKQYLSAINNGKIPQILPALDRVIESELRNINEMLLNSYKEAMNKLTNDKPMDDDVLYAKHRDFMKSIQDRWDEKMKNWADSSKKDKMKMLLQKEYQIKVKRNQHLTTVQCNSLFNEFQSNYTQPQINIPEDITQALLSHKFQQFTKKIQPYFQQCKNPRKFIFFAKTFPKAIYEYFDVFLAKVKGAFHQQIIDNEQQAKNNQTKIESLGRIINEQNILLQQKQKQIQNIIYEKDTIKRELQKELKMKEFQKDNEKLNKGETKKRLEYCQQQLLQAEQKISQLQQQINRLKKNNGGNHHNQITMNTNDTTNDENRSQNGELFSTIEDLTQYLIQMRDYYKKNIVQYQTDDIKNKQIEDLREAKHISLAQAKEEIKVIKQQYRKNLSKISLQKDGHIQTLNKYIDDLKEENIQLLKQLEKSPCNETKLKNFIKERKQFEESLRLKQNNINLLTAVNSEKQQKNQQFHKQSQKFQEKIALLRAENANLQSYKQTYLFILRESLNWVLNKNNKLKHSVRTLSPEQMGKIKKIFKELNLNPF